MKELVTDGIWKELDNSTFFITYYLKEEVQAKHIELFDKCEMSEMFYWLKMSKCHLKSIPSSDLMHIMSGCSLIILSSPLIQFLFWQGRILKSPVNKVALVFKSM